MLFSLAVAISSRSSLIVVFNWEIWNFSKFISTAELKPMPFFSKLQVKFWPVLTSFGTNQGLLGTRQKQNKGQNGNHTHLGELADLILML